MPATQYKAEDKNAGTLLWLLFLETFSTFARFLTQCSVSFIAVFPRTFNPADYAEPAQTEENYGGGNTWNNTRSTEMEEGASKLIY